LTGITESFLSLPNQLPSFKLVQVRFDRSPGHIGEVMPVVKTRVRKVSKLQLASDGEQWHYKGHGYHKKATQVTWTKHCQRLKQNIFGSSGAHHFTRRFYVLQICQSAIWRYLLLV